MNLIEQLGGYEKAKKLVGDCKRYGRGDVKVPVNGGFIHVVADFLELDLLEYRRQHNIFEVGDNYVYLHEWDGDLDIVCKFNPSEWCDHLWNIRNMIRHATPEEIKAGRRL